MTPGTIVRARDPTRWPTTGMTGTWRVLEASGDILHLAGADVANALQRQRIKAEYVEAID